MSDHAHVPPNSLIASRYRVIREAGTGNFARVFVCADTRSSNKMVAVKLLKRGFDRDAEFERDVLTAVNKRDPDDRHNVVKMLAFFKWNDHSCFAFPLKGGGTLKARLASANRQKLPRGEVCVIARDLAESMMFLHNTARIIHTDLKPENMLLDDGGDTDRWCVCDFGSASFVQDQSDSDLISTRPYRAPEVVLGSEWTCAVDMWSIGCILYECVTGSKMFDAMQDDAHLSLMEHHLGPVTESVVRKGSRKVVSQCFGSDGRLRAMPQRGRKMAEVLREDPELLDLMCHLLRYEPHRRLRAQDMLNHPFVLAAGNAPRAAATPQHMPLYAQVPQSNASDADNSPGSVASYRNTPTASPPRYMPIMSPQQSFHQPVAMPSKMWPRELQPRALPMTRETEERHSIYNQPVPAYQYTRETVSARPLSSVHTYTQVRASSPSIFNRPPLQAAPTYEQQRMLQLSSMQPRW